MGTLRQRSCFTDPGSKITPSPPQLHFDFVMRLPVESSSVHRDLWLLVPCCATAWNLSFRVCRRDSCCFSASGDQASPPDLKAVSTLTHIHSFGLDALHPAATDPRYWRERYSIVNKIKVRPFVSVSKFRRAKSMCIFTRRRYCATLAWFEVDFRKRFYFILYSILF